MLPSGGESPTSISIKAMPFTSETAPLKHYPDGFSKEDTDDGYCVIPQPPRDDSNNTRQLVGGKIARQVLGSDKPR